MRGLFIRGDGLQLPNLITSEGSQRLLRAGFRNEGFTLYFGLCQVVPSKTLTENDLSEPTIGVNGYARQAISGSADWATIGFVGGEAYVETRDIVFVASGGNFSTQINRCFLAFNAAKVGTSAVFSAGAIFPNDLLITPTTPAPERTFRYRIYL